MVTSEVHRLYGTFSRGCHGDGSRLSYYVFSKPTVNSSTLAIKDTNSYVCFLVARKTYSSAASSCNLCSIYKHAKNFKGHCHDYYYHEIIT